MNMYGLQLNKKKSQMMRLGKKDGSIFDTYSIANFKTMTSRYKYLGTEIQDSSEQNSMIQKIL